MLLLALALTLTLCFGVAAWRLSAGNDVEITATIPHEGIQMESRGRGTECLALGLRLHPGDYEREP